MQATGHHDEAIRFWNRYCGSRNQIDSQAPRIGGVSPGDHAVPLLRLASFQARVTGSASGLMTSASRIATPCYVGIVRGLQRVTVPKADMNFTWDERRMVVKGLFQRRNERNRGTVEMECSTLRDRPHCEE